MTTLQKNNHTILLVIAAIVVVLVVVVGVRYAFAYVNAPIRNLPAIAEETKRSLGVPTKIDRYTTLTDITAENKTIVYHYTLRGLDESLITNQKLKANAVSGVCANKDSRGLLDMGATMNYTYTQGNERDKYSFSVTKDDCS